MLALALVAVSVGFSNLAASIGIGVGGVSAATRIRVLLTFGLFEAGMPIVGLVIGHNLASDIGRDAKWIGALLLVGVGVYGIYGFIRGNDLGNIGHRRRKRRRADGDERGDAAGGDGDRLSGAAKGDGDQPGGAGGVDGKAAAVPVRTPQAARRREFIKIAISGFALSLDNLIAGFALGGYQVNLITGALVFGVVSIGMSLAGLEFGSRLGGWAGDSGELIGGIVLIGVGIAIGSGALG